jgi:hypothetical protein
MRNWWNAYKELVGDAMVIFFGGWMVFIFITIEIYGRYGVEHNAFMRWFELIGSGAVGALGIDRFVGDIRRMVRDKKANGGTKNE